MYQQVIKFEFWIYRQVLQLTYYISERNTNLFGTHCVLENVPDHFLRIDYIFWTQFSMQIQTSSHLDSDWTCKFGTMFWRTMKLHSERRHIHFAPLSWFVHSYSFSINIINATETSLLIGCFKIFVIISLHIIIFWLFIIIFPWRATCGTISVVWTDLN